MAESRKRWDTDERFTGVADASAFAPAVEELAALARRPGWVAEDPEIHLGPHRRRWRFRGYRLVRSWRQPPRTPATGVGASRRRRRARGQRAGAPRRRCR